MQRSKSPFNYIGNKYRLMATLEQYFPSNINTMVDLFCGGCDVSINVEAQNKYANDLNCYLIEICKTFQQYTISDLLLYIDQTINEWGLSKDNKQGYLNFRAYYNRTRKPLDLYILMCYSFNYQFRFNAALEYNNPFGNARSSFNNNMRNNLLEFKRRIEFINFSSNHFMKFNYEILKKGDFIYADPPYRISCGSYNDGKRGFEGWKEKDDLNLFQKLTELSNRGVLFALSNVIEHKGLTNELLAQWIAEHKYTVHPINFNYNNCNYQTKNKNQITKEILVTNY